MRKRWVGHETLLEGNKNACSVLVIKSEKKMPLGRPRGFWGDSIKMCIVLFQPVIQVIFFYFNNIYIIISHIYICIVHCRLK